MKKLLVLSLCALMLASCGNASSEGASFSTVDGTVSAKQTVMTDASSVTSAAEEPETENTTTTAATTAAPAETTTTTTVTEPRPEDDPPEISCTAAALYCVEDDKLLFGYGMDAHAAPASIAKLVTALTALEYLELNSVVTVGTELELVEPESSLCYIGIGQEILLNDLLRGLLMASGNDAAYTIAAAAGRAASGDESMDDEDAVDRFCELMNEEAALIGMKDSCFKGPDGWDHPEQYVTAADLIVLARRAMTVPAIRKIAQTQDITVQFETGETAYWVNSNKLLDPESDYYTEEAIGLKTGTTEDAGSNLIAAFEKDGKTYISVVLGCEDDEDRYELTLWLYNSFAE